MVDTTLILSLVGFQGLIGLLLMSYSKDKMFQIIIFLVTSLIALSLTLIFSKY